MKLRIDVVGLIFLLLRACMHPVYYDGPYTGRVVDATTGAPLADVVVLGTWRKLVYVGPGGGYSEPYDAQEVVTDAQGNFAIPGLGLRFFSLLEPMRVLIFKAGYEHFGNYRWESMKKDPLLSPEITWEGKRAIIPLKKLTLEERKEKGAPARPGIPIEKMQLLTREINKDRIERGLDPFEIRSYKK